MTRRLFALTAVCCLALPLASCGTFSGYVSDHWPHWAGGMPDDVPPRPGAPGYEEFIAHKPEGKDAATPGAIPVAQKVAGPAEPAAAPAPRQNPPPTDPPTGDQNAGQGGLY